MDIVNLPLLPGYTFRDVNVQDYKLPHKFDILNGFRVVRNTSYGIGKRPTDAASAAYAEAADFVEYEPSLTYGRVPRYTYRQFIPRYALLAQKRLCFKAFFRRAVFDSLNEHYRVRHVNIIYYLEDDTLCVVEPVVENAGFRQGKLVRREKIPKNAKGDYFNWKDFNVGIDVCIHSVVYHIVDCSPFTREFLTSQGVDVGEAESSPVDPYTEQRNVKYRTPKRVARVTDDSKRRFLEYDRMVLSFDATWNDDRYRAMYFLTDDTMAIREIHESNDGKDPVTMLLKRTRVPKDWKSLPSWHPSIYLEYEDSEIVEYYTPRDFRLGETIAVFGRRFLLHDCDSFTRKYYSDVLGIQQPSAIPLPAKMSDKLMTKYKAPSPPPPPPHIAFGSPEDTYASCLSFSLRPPKKNVIRQIANFPKKLRYSARMDAVHPEDEDRDFVLEYSLSDGTVQISEIEKRNSGRREGCFLSWTLIPKPAARKDDPVYYTPDDFFVGARINIFNHHFVITGADFFVYRYVAANPDKFSQNVRQNLRNYFLQQGTVLRDDVDVEARKIQEAKDERDLAIGAIATSSENNHFDASECTNEFDTATVKMFD